MGFFKDFKDDFSQAVNELLPGEDNLNESTEEEDLVVNTLESEVDVESELSKLDGLLEQVTSKNVNQTAQTGNANQAAQTKAAAQSTQVNKDTVQPGNASAVSVEKTMEQSAVEGDNEAKKTQEERKMQENGNPVVNETKPVSDEVSVITEGTIIKGDIVSNGSLDIRGNVQGDIGCNGKLVVTGTVTGNSNSSEFFADAAKIEGEVVSTGTVKIGLGSVIIGNVTSTSAVIAGAIKGDIDVQGPVVVDTSAVVMGNIKSRSVQINNGAVIEGFCSQCYSDVDVESLFESKKEGN